MTKIIFIVLGSVFLGLGVIGIILPGIPGTPFLLIASALYVRSSSRLYGWLMNHPVLGTHIRGFREHRAMSRKSKIVALCSMWLAIGISTVFVFNHLLVRIAMVAAGLVGTVVILRVPILQEDGNIPDQRNRSGGGV